MAIGVLLVDDNPSHLDLFRILIELDDDMRLLGAASDGETGVAEAAALQPDVILSDIEMPRLDGVNAAPLYRRVAPSAAVVLMSCLEITDGKSLANRAGADLYIDKNTGVDTMVQSLKACVAERRSRPAVIDLCETAAAAPSPAGVRSTV